VDALQVTRAYKFATGDRSQLVITDTEMMQMWENPDRHLYQHEYDPDPDPFADKKAFFDEA
jgi:hypothetical protein